MSADSDKKENCGLFGIYGDPQAVQKCYFGIHSLQHRGQESAGIASSDGEQIRCYKGVGTVRRVFRGGSWADEGDMLMLWLRFTDNGVELEIGYGDDFDDEDDWDIDEV